MRRIRLQPLDARKSDKESEVRAISKTRFGLMFAVHQVIALWVVIVSAQVLTASVCNVLRLFGLQNYRAVYTWILSGNPYFPAQVGLGLLLGWLLARSLRDPSMKWVWVLTSIVLSYALVAIPALTPNTVPFELQAGKGQSRLHHYFGWGCQFTNHCVDQSTFTRPFYATLAYSLGALLALKTTKSSASKVQFLMLLITGIAFVAGAIYDSVNSIRYGWNWMILVVEATPIGTGVYLILLALGSESELARHLRRA